jgi:hypothetical protein
MRTDDPRDATFAWLDEMKGFPATLPKTEEEFPLPSWYREVRDIPLGQLSIGDICKACRQRIHLNYIAPIALDLLEANPLAGEMFDGELLLAMKAVPEAYWREDRIQRNRLLGILRSFMPDLSGDIKKDVDDLRNRLEVG